MTGSFVEVVRRHALQTPQAPAVTDPATAWSWADLWRRAHQIGGALADRGIGSATGWGPRWTREPSTSRS